MTHCFPIMLRRLVPVLGLISCLLTTPTLAQFGLGKNKLEGTSFEDLKAEAERLGGGHAGGPKGGRLNKESMQEYLKTAWANPDVKDQMAGLHENMGAFMEQLADMDPDELAKQMQQAMEMITSGDMMDKVMGKKEELLANLEQSGMVPDEALAQYKSDPKFFEKAMREAFDQMKGVFNDPDILETVSETMKGMSDPSLMELTTLIEQGMTDDVKMEEARLELLSNPELAKNPLFETIFAAEEFQDVLKDPKKWRDTFRNQLGGGILGASDGEL